MPSWDLGLSPCHFLAQMVEVSGIGTASHAHTHTHTQKHHSPRWLSSRVVWMISSAVDTMTGGVWSVPDAQLGSGTLSLSFPRTKG